MEATRKLAPHLNVKYLGKTKNEIERARLNLIKLAGT